MLIPIQTIPQGTDAVEIVDQNDCPLGVMSLVEVHRQTLYHRAVLVLLYDISGRLLLQKRSQSKSLYPGRWDLSATGHVKANESREAAGRRELLEELGVSAPRLKVLAQLPATQDTGNEFVTLFSAGTIRGTIRANPDEVDESIFVDNDELDAMVENFRELLTPAVVYFWEKGLLFGHKD